VTVAAASLVLSVAMTGCTSDTYHANIVPGVRIQLVAFADWSQPSGHECCRVITINPSRKAWYANDCRVTAKDADGRVLYDDTVNAGPPGGLYAPPGRHKWGFISIRIPHPDRVVSAVGICQAWDWGRNGPPI
jgi:hypothetical protein